MKNINAALKARNLTHAAYAKLGETQKAAVQKAADLARIDADAAKWGRNVNANRHA